MVAFGFTFGLVSDFMMLRSSVLMVKGDELLAVLWRLNSMSEVIPLAENEPRKSRSRSALRLALDERLLPLEYSRIWSRDKFLDFGIKDGDFGIFLGNQTKHLKQDKKAVKYE